MNLNYGKLIDGAIEYAPDYLDTKYGRINYPTENNYRFYGWKKIVKDSNIVYGWYETGDIIRSINPNTNYGKLVDGIIEYAPDVLLIDGKYVEPTEEQYLEAGLKKIYDNHGPGEFKEYVDLDAIYVIRLTSDYGKLVDGNIELAPDMLVYDNSINMKPSDEQYLEAGFKKVEFNEPPPVPDGYTLLGPTYDENETTIFIKWELVENPPEPVPPRVFSKRNLELAIFNSGVPGLLAKVDAFINSQEVTNEFGDKIPLRRLYDTALTLSEDNNQFNEFLTAIKSSIPELTDELIETILSNSIAK